MQFAGQAKPPVGVAFDSDFGDGIDDVLALAMLNGIEGKGEARLISTSTTKSNLNAVAFCEVLAKFFSTPVPTPGAPPVSTALPGFGGFQRPMPPIGMADNGKLADDTAVLKGVLDRKTAEGKPVYEHNVLKFNDTADPLAVIRNAFTAQNDENCVMVLAGPATNLAGVLGLPGSVELIKRKVKFLVIAAGAYPDGTAPDFNIKADLPAAKRLFAEWPTPIVAAGSEVGVALPYPGASIEKDFAWATNHPLVDAYRAYKPMPYDAPARAMAAMLYAVHPDDFFKLSEPGAISITDDGRAKFTLSATGKHRYLVVDPAKKDQILQTYVAMASAKPAPRQQRVRPPQQKKDAAEPPKKP